MEQLIAQVNQTLADANSVYRIYQVNGQAMLGDVSGVVYDGEPVESGELLGYVDDLIADEKSCQ